MSETDRDWGCSRGRATARPPHFIIQLHTIPQGVMRTNYIRISSLLLRVIPERNSMDEQESKDLEKDICPVCYVDSNLCGCGYRWWEEEG